MPNCKLLRWSFRRFQKESIGVGKVTNDLLVGNEKLWERSFPAVIHFCFLTPLFMKSTLVSCFLFLCLSTLQAQTLQRVKNTPLGTVKDMSYNERYGLFVAGQFEGWGINAGSVAMFANGSDVPDTDFPRFYDNASDIISDDNGGWYVAGTFFRTINENDASSYNKFGIVHILPDNQIDPDFVVELSAVSSDISGDRSTVTKLFKKGNFIYAVGDYNDGFSRLITNVVALNATTGKAVYFPKIKGIVRADETGGVLYAVGNSDLRDSTDASYGKNAVAIHLQKKQIRQWNPVFADAQVVMGNTVMCTGGKVLLSYTKTSTEAGIAAFDTTNVASTPVSWSYHVPYMHAWTVYVQGMFAYNQAIYLPVWTTGNKYVLHAVNVGDGMPLNGWNVNQFSFEGDGGFQYSAAVTKAVVQGSNVYLYGYFDRVNQATRKNWAAIDLSTNQILDWDIKATTVVTTPNPLYAYQDKLFCLARPGDSYYHYKARPHLALLNPITQELITNQFSFLPADPTNTWYVSKLATNDKTLWVSVLANGTRTAGNGYLGAYDILTGAQLNTGNFEFRYQGNISQDFTKLQAVETTLYMLGRFTTLNGQSRPAGLAAVTESGDVLPFTLTADGQITDFTVMGNLLYVSGNFTQINGTNRKNLASVNRLTGELTDWSPNPERPVTTFSISGNNIFFSRVDEQNGQYKSYLVDRITGSTVHILNRQGQIANSIAKEQYVFMDADPTCNASTYFDTERKIYAPQCLPNTGYKAWPMTFAGSKLFLYPEPVYLPTGIMRQRLMQVTYPPGFFTEDVGYFPKFFGNVGTSTVHFYSYNLSPGTRIILSKSQQPNIEIPTSSLNYYEPYTAKTEIDFTGVATGFWNIKLIYPNGIIEEIQDGLEVIPLSPPLITSELVGPSTLRPGRVQTYVVTIQNRGTADAYLVPVWLIAPKDSKIEQVFTPIKLVNNQLLLDTLIYIPIDSLDGAPYGGRLYGFCIGKLAGSESFNLDLKVTPLAVPDALSPFRISVTANYPLFTPYSVVQSNFTNTDWFNNQGTTCTANLVWEKLELGSSAENLSGCSTQKIKGSVIPYFNKLKAVNAPDRIFIDWFAILSNALNECKALTKKQLVDSILDANAYYIDITDCLRIKR